MISTVLLVKAELAELLYNTSGTEAASAAAHLILLHMQLMQHDLVELCRLMASAD